MTSFNQLKQDLIDLTENNSSDFSSESPQFIDTAERRLARELINVPELYKHQNATLTIGHTNKHKHAKILCRLGQ